MKDLAVLLYGSDDCVLQGHTKSTSEKPDQSWVGSERTKSLRKRCSSPSRLYPNLVLGQGSPSGCSIAFFKVPKSSSTKTEIRKRRSRDGHLQRPPAVLTLSAKRDKRDFNC